MARKYFPSLDQSIAYQYPFMQWPHREERMGERGPAAHYVGPITD